MMLPLNRRFALIALAYVGVALACSGSEPPASSPPPSETAAGPATVVSGVPTPVRPTPTADPPGGDETARAFDQTVLHTIELTVSPGDVARLTPGSDERVRARLTFDGTSLPDVGLRLKGGEASQRPVNMKAGFSVDTDKFVNKRSLFGVTRFTLGNGIEDQSFVTEALVYQVFRDAGLVAPRTALADVRFNGESYGVYVVREGYDKNFLRRRFENPDGNLYEGGLRVDVTDVQDMGARTNEDKNDRSDLEAVARIVANEPDATLLRALGDEVDLDYLLTYWAVESITHHWDGYVRPNNYYVYNDPARGAFVFLPHGADWAMLDPEYSALAQPGVEARLAYRLYENAEFRSRLRTRVLQVLDQHWDAAKLTALADQLGALVRATALQGAKEETNLAVFEEQLATRKAFVARRADAIREQLSQ